MTSEAPEPIIKMSIAGLISTIPTDVNLFALFSHMGFLGNHRTFSRAFNPFSPWKPSLRYKQLLITFNKSEQFRDFRIDLPLSEQFLIGAITSNCNC